MRKEYEEFRKTLLRRREELARGIERLSREAIRSGASGDVSSAPVHMADMASDSFDQELATNLAENEERLFNLIDEALLKFDAGTYGRCERCGEEISRERLRAVPYAQACLSCQEEVEREERGAVAWRAERARFPEDGERS